MTTRLDLTFKQPWLSADNRNKPAALAVSIGTQRRRCLFLMWAPHAITLGGACLYPGGDGDG